MGKEILPNCLAEMRIKANLSQEDVVSATGINQSDLSKWENHKKPISVEHAVLLADLYRVGLDEMFQRKINYSCDYRLKIDAGKEMVLTVKVEGQDQIKDLMRILRDNHYVATLKRE